MTNKIICVVAIVILGICLVSGGCDSAVENQKIKAWKDLITLVPEKEQPADSESTKKDATKVQTPSPQAPKEETTQVKLYFAQAGQENLAVEERTITKTEGIARSTMEELIKGPANAELSGVFPQGSKLRDINIKEDGTCVIDLSSEVENVSDAEQEKLMIHAVANTLGQFPTVKEVSFLINGQKVNEIKGGVDLSSPVKPQSVAEK